MKIKWKFANRRVPKYHKFSLFQYMISIIIIIHNSNIWPDLMFFTFRYHGGTCGQICNEVRMNEVLANTLEQCCRPDS